MLNNIDLKTIEDIHIFIGKYTEKWLLVKQKNLEPLRKHCTGFLLVHCCSNSIKGTIKAPMVEAPIVHCKIKAMLKT